MHSVKDEYYEAKTNLEQIVFKYCFILFYFSKPTKPYIYVICPSRVHSHCQWIR